MNLQEIYKEHYFFEINRKHQLTSQLGIPIGVLTILGGAIAFFVKSTQYDYDMEFLFLGAAIVISIFFLGRTIYYLIRSYYGFTYRYIPTPKEIEGYKKELSAYYKTERYLKGDAYKEVKEFLLERYAICTHENTINNDKKSAYLHKANTSLIFILIFVMLCCVPYLLIKFAQPEKVQKIEIINLTQPLLGKENIMAEENQDQEEQEGQDPPKKPERPPDRLIRESEPPPEDRNSDE